MDKLGNQYVSSYRNEGYLPVSKRLTAGFVDAMLLIILSFGLMIASSEIAMAVPSYSEKIETINASRVALYELQEETLLYEYPVDQDGNKDYSTPISQNKVFEKYCYENILYTYSLCKDEWDLAYTLGNDDPTAEAKLASYSPTSYDTDRLAYFYVTYASAHNANGNLFVLQQGETYISHFKTILRNASAGAEWDYFEGDDRLPALSMAFAHRLYRYLVFSEGGQDGLNAYNFLITQYQTLFDDAGQILYQSDAYQALYQTYFSAYGECSRVVSLFSFLSYVVSFLLLILLPSLLFKNGETLGLFLRKGTLLHQDRLEVSKGQVLLRDLASFFTLFPTLLVSCYFAGGFNSGWMYPLFSIGGAGVSLFNLTLISLVFPIVNLAMALIRKDKRGFTELLSNTILIDRSYYVDHRLEVENEKEKEEEAKTPTPVSAEVPYFDSSCFENTERPKPFDDDSDSH